MPKMQLSTIFNFSASHFLTKYHGKCENLHGHNYKLIVTVEGKVGKDGMVIDYKEIKKTVNDLVIDKIDHTHLNDLMDNPSSEHLVLWIWKALKDELPLKNIRLYETENYYCDYDGK